MATYKKRNGKWQARLFYIDDVGRRKEKAKTFETKREAMRWAQEIELHLKDGLSKTDIPFVDYFQKWYELYKKPKITPRTERHYQLSKKTIETYFGRRVLGSITRDDIQLFVNSFAQGTDPFKKPHAKETVDKVFIHLRSCLKKAVRDGVFRFNPAEDIVITGAVKSKEEELKFLSEADQIKLRKYLMQNLEPNKPVNFMILTALDTGMRLGELLGLTWEKISAKEIYVSQSYDYTTDTIIPTKNDNPRKVAITTDLFRILNKLQKRSYVFASYLNKPLSTSFVSREFKKAQIKSGIENPITFHGLRHSHASLMLYKGMNIKSLARRLGHRDIQTTLNIYAHLLDEMEKEQIELMQTVISEQYHIL